MTKMEQQTKRYDAFISHSSQDAAFAAKLKKALEKYRPPKDLGLPQRRLNIFLDIRDLIGSDYLAAVNRFLENSAKLIVICSPNARRSEFVNNEIRRFTELNDAMNIIPIIIEGIPNNMASPDDENEMAFPEALLQVLEMPLAISYIDFDYRRDKVNRNFFERSWFSLLANIYGISRNDLEQRDKRWAQRYGMIITISIAANAVLLITTALLLIKCASINWSSLLSKEVYLVVFYIVIIILGVLGTRRFWNLRLAKQQSIFIAYRRSDSQDMTGRIYDKLTSKLGKNVLFRDIDSMPYGEDFREHVSQTLARCKIVLVVIGDTWLKVEDSSGNRRIDNPQDNVRTEIEIALKLNVPIIPLLIRSAKMPGQKELPNSIKKLAFRNGMSIRSDPDFHPDTNRLSKELRTRLKKTRPYRDRDL